MLASADTVSRDILAAEIFAARLRVKAVAIIQMPAALQAMAAAIINSTVLLAIAIQKDTVAQVMQNIIAMVDVMIQ